MTNEYKLKRLQAKLRELKREIEDAEEIMAEAEEMHIFAENARFVCCEKIEKIKLQIKKQKKLCQKKKS